jgi:radical SAM superfamily enzyme YgiQ (UPF0313 family)
MNVMFIDPPSEMGTASESVLTTMPTPNMGIIYMATYIRQKTGANIFVLDMAANKIKFKDLPDLLNNFQPSIVGISSKTFNILSAFKLSNIIKNISPETVIIAGGAHPTALPDYTLNECPDIDAIVLREGEETLLDLIESMKNGNNLINDNIFKDIFGIVYRNRYNQIVTNRERSLITDLDSLPFPDLALVDYNRYRRVYNPNKHKFQHIYPVFASRGCPFNCTFCMPLHTRKHRVRNIESILDEIELMNKKYGAERIYFEDSLFCTTKEWFMQFCEKYKEKGLHKKIQWGFETRIDTADIEIFSQAKDSGCIYTFFGVESGNEIILSKANKRYTKASIFEKVAAAKLAGIDEVNISIILGLPYETKETIEETLNLIEELPFDNASINILDIYPGTTTFEMADKGEGGIKWVEGKRMNWSAYSREDPMVEVNDLSSMELLEARKKALRIIATKSKKNKVALNTKRLAYLIELAKTDRHRLLRKLKKIINEI